MIKCSYCGEDIRVLPFECPHCGKAFCVHHRLSDNHECSNDLAIEKIRASELKKTIDREEIFDHRKLAEVLNRELKLLVELGFTSSEQLKEECTDLGQFEVYHNDDCYMLNYKEFTRDFANTSMFYNDRIVIGNYNVIALKLYQEEIPESIKLLKKLKILVIDNADIKEFPKALAQLSNIRYLYIKKSSLTDIPNLVIMFPKLIYLGLNGVKLRDTPDWLFKFARKHHSRQYIRRSLEDMNQLSLFHVGWIKTVRFNQGVDKKDAAVLGLLEILIGMPLNNDQVVEKIAQGYSVGRSISRYTSEIYPFGEPREKIPDELYNKIMDTQSKMAEWLRNTPDEATEEMLRMPWDYNDLSCEPRYTLNDSGNVIGLDIAILPCESGELLLPYFPEEICKLHNLQVLRVGFCYSDEHYNHVQAQIPESIQELKELRYFWTNARYSPSLWPYLNTLKKFGEISRF